MTRNGNLRFLFVFFVAVRMGNIDGLINAIWPYIDSIPFPYPTNNPININITQARPIFTFPLKFINNLSLTCTMKNTGLTVLLTPDQLGLANITGGVLFNDVYTFIQQELFWDDSPRENAANRVNGKGSPVIVVGSYYNTKYGSYQNAKSKRDGIAQVVFYINLGFIDNPLFYPFQFSMRQILKADSTTKVSEALASIWFYASPTFISYYYAYPGQFVDRSTGIGFFDSTVLLFVQIPRPSISINQFKATFGSLKNLLGYTYSHTMNHIYPRLTRPIVSTFGYKLLLV